MTDLIHQHIGTWEGTLTEVDPGTGMPGESRRTRITMAIEGDRYRQKNEYWFADGREQVIEFEGTIIDGAIEIDLPMIRATARPIGPATMYFTSSRPGAESASHEVTTLLAPDHRCRTTMILADGAYVRASYWDERRVSP